jgi:hypothetical protein
MLTLEVEFDSDSEASTHTLKNSPTGTASGSSTKHSNDHESFAIIPTRQSAAKNSSAPPQVPPSTIFKSVGP